MDRLDNNNSCWLGRLGGERCGLEEMILLVSRVPSCKMSCSGRSGRSCCIVNSVVLSLTVGRLDNEDNEDNEDGSGSCNSDDVGVGADGANETDLLTERNFVL